MTVTDIVYELKQGIKVNYSYKEWLALIHLIIKTYEAN